MNERKELGKMKRVELLELLLDVTQENEKLRAKNRKLAKRLASRQVVAKKAGSIAEASMRLSGVFKAAQNAADGYLNSLKQMEEDSSGMIREAELEAARIIEEAKQESAEIRRKARKQAFLIKRRAKRESDDIWQQTQTNISRVLETENTLNMAYGHLKKREEPR